MTPGRSSAPSQTSTPVVRLFIDFSSILTFVAVMCLFIDDGMFYTSSKDMGINSYEFKFLSGIGRRKNNNEEETGKALLDAVDVE